MTEFTIKQALSHFIDPYLHQDWSTAGCIKSISQNPDRILLDIVVGYPIKTVMTDLIREAKTVLSQQLKCPPGQIEITLHSVIHSHQTQSTALKGVPNIKNIIAVGSGKGGVGKSTVAVNLALALQQQGACVGILDADIYGPSQPHLLGTDRPPTLTEDKKLQPVMCYGLQTMSIGYLVDSDKAMIWRGPMVSTALKQLLHDTLWDTLDYLIVDLPPGTGDIPLTLAQKIPVSGAVVITTPQDLSLIDAKRAIALFEKLNIPMLGIVENMSDYQCPHCGYQDPIFGQQGGRALAKSQGVPLLGNIPLATQIRHTGDAGKPVVVAEASGQNTNTEAFLSLARQTAGILSLKPKNYASKFPTIVVE